MVFHVKYIDKKMIYLLLIFWRHLPSYDIDVSFNPNPYELSTTKEGGLYFILSDGGNYDFKCWGWTLWDCRFCRACKWLWVFGMLIWETRKCILL